MRALSTFLAALLLLVCSPVALLSLRADEQQDIVYLKDGTKREGVIDEENAGAIRLRGKLGAIWIERRDIARIDRAPTLLEQFQKRLSSLKPDDLAGYFGLAVWCKEKGLEQQARQLFSRVVTLDPNHTVARRELGYIPVDGKWVLEEDHMRARGFVRYKNSWVPPTRALIAGLLDEFLADKKTREMVFSALNELGESCETDLRDILVEDISTMAELLTEPRLHEACRELRTVYQRERSKALGLITNPAKYNDDENSYAARAEVRTLMTEIELIFCKPLEYHMEHAGELRQVGERVRLLAEYCKRKLPDFAAAAREKLESSTSKASLVLNPSIFENDDTLFPFVKENKKVAAANGEAESWLAPDEAACIRLINSYRYMMGLRILRADERLARTARKHSAEMLERNYFSHDSPNSEMRGVDRRALTEGFRGLYVGENIAKGEFTVEAIFQAWRESPGHHRNLLNPVYYSIGSGKRGQYWTAVFGGKEWR